MQNIRRQSLFMAIAFLSVSPLWGQTVNQEEILKKIDTYAQQVMKEWQIPGMGLSIVKDNAVIYAKGFGVRELGKNLPVDEHSSFQIGSVSKSFTALLMAMLVDEGKVSWDDPIKMHLPDFEMYDPWISNNLLVKDIMIHRTGLPNQCGTYIPNLGYEQEDIYKMFKLIKPASSLRTTYAYNNITFIIAAKIIEKYMGKPWEECIKERIFIPLEMNESSVNEKGFTAAKNVTVPHSFEYKNGAIVCEPMFGEEQALHWLTVIGPAGGIISSASDMTKWVRFHLSNGTFNGKQILSEDNMKYLHRGQLITSQTDSKVTIYGHCWFIEQNNKYKVFFHTGTTWGFSTLCVFVPELNLGMTFLAGSEVPSDPRYAVMRRLIDLYIGAPDKDYSAETLKDWYVRSAKSEGEAKVKAEEVVKMSPAAYTAYTGVYEKEVLGAANIWLEGKDLFITIGPKNWKSKLTHVNGNDFAFRMGGHEFPVHFEMSASGTAASLDIEMEYNEYFGPWMKK